MKLRLVTAMFTVSAVCACAIAQKTPDETMRQKVSVEYTQAAVTSVIKLLFAQVDANYSLDPSIQGSVTLRLKDVEFGTALRTVLNQVNATFRIEGGVWNIVPKEPPAPELPPASETLLNNPEPERPFPQKVTVMHVDPAVIAELIGGYLLPTEPYLSQFLGGSSFGGANTPGMTTGPGINGGNNPGFGSPGFGSPGFGSPGWGNSGGNPGRIGSPNQQNTPPPGRGL